jgi:rubredoxin
MYQKPTIKINLTGGLVSPNELLTILYIARKTAVSNISFGARQQLLMSVHPREMELFTSKMQEANIAFETDMEVKPTITSSFAFTDILQNTDSSRDSREGWVSEGEYLDIFSLFDYKPSLKINICDNAQSHAPFFTGHINFISSDIPHFWFCYIRFPKTNTIERFPKLVYTQDIATFSRQLEDGLQLSKSTVRMDSFGETFGKLDAIEFENVIFRQIDNDLTIPRFVMPYYEGVNRQTDGKLWLGIYRRNEDFSVKFLTEMCQLCEETRIGNICVTNWRSLIIKGISKEDRFKWEKLLGKHGINVRHANNELNWQTEEDSIKGFKLKQYLVKQFDAMDVRTFGLVFAIKTRHKSEVFGSVIIRREPLFKFGKYEFNPFGLFESYDIFYAEDFNPHTRKRKTFRVGIPKSRLSEELLKLAKKYYAELASEKKTVKIKLKQEDLLVKNVKMVHRCKDCWTVFDAHTEGGVAFENVASDYVCPVCEADKTGFELVNF